MSRVIIAGSGIAGLTCALRLAGRHEVTVVTKGSLGESNTAWAQGGIAGVVGPDDTVASHVADTLTAGAGHCIDEAVEVLCSSGADALFTLAAAGVEFDRDETGAWARGMEGAHSFARIFHAGGDATGRRSPPRSRPPPAPRRPPGGSACSKTPCSSTSPRPASARAAPSAPPESPCFGTDVSND